MGFPITIQVNSEALFDHMEIGDVVHYFGEQDILEVIDEDKIAQFINEGSKFVCMSQSDGEKFVDIEKSMGTEPFYDLLVKNIMEGKLSLEMLIGKVTIEKLKPSIKKPE